MARAGLLYLSDAVLEKHRKQIPYRSAKLTRAGYGVDETTPINFIMKDLKPGSSKRASKSKANSWAKTAAEQLRESNSGAERYEIETVETLRIADALRLWRRCEAKRLALPPFCIFNDRVLQTIAAKRPGSGRDLLAVPGVGRRIVEKYGADIYGIVRRGNT
jgi:superfamily II DNA helicase RecQ